MAKQPKLVKCKHCGEEIAASAKVCPKCGGKNKKPIYKRPWFIIIVVLIAIIVISNIGGNNEPSKTANNDTVVNDKNSTPNETQEEINYTVYNVSELMSDLESNALKAADKYKNKYVELTGKINVIDSSGKYISIVPVEDDFAITGVLCYIKNDDQKAAIMDMSVGDIVIVKGKITDVGEVMGYYLDIDEISK